LQIDARTEERKKDTAAKAPTNLSYNNLQSCG
jgi:hypothetical protein